ncbi:MAG: polyprenyl synthetase family protein [Ignavibacteriales bacterium]|nr:polyprenyl synthetase family protein [Ignavibacteriales bacterium]
MDNADLRRGNLTLHKKYNLNTAIFDRRYSCCSCL